MRFAGEPGDEVEVGIEVGGALEGLVADEEVGGVDGLVVAGEDCDAETEMGRIPVPREHAVDCRCPEYQEQGRMVVRNAH